MRRPPSYVGVHACLTALVGLVRPLLAAPHPVAPFPAAMLMAAVPITGPPVTALPVTGLPVTGLPVTGLLPNTHPAAAPWLAAPPAGPRGAPAVAAQRPGLLLVRPKQPGPRRNPNWTWR